MKLLSHLLSLSFALLLVGCGGGSSSTDNGGSTSGTNLSGIAAVGAPLQNANVTVKGSLGLTVVNTTFDEGAFTVDVSTLTAPYMLKVNDSSRGVELYSYAASITSNVNITPVTSLIMAQSLPSDATLQDLFTNFVDTDFAQLESNISTQTLAINDLVTNDGFSEFNHFSGEFTADSTGYDAVLDELNITFYGSSVVLLDDNYEPIVVTNEVSLSGRIVNDSNTPLENITIIATNTSADTTINITATSDSSGEFVLTLLRDQNFNIQALADGYQTVEVNNISTQTQSSNISLSTIIMTAETELVTYSATIIDASSTDTAINGVDVTLRSGQNNKTDAAMQTTSSNSGGQFSFADLAPGNYTLELSKNGYHTQFENVFVNSGSADGQLFLVPQQAEPEAEPTESIPVVTSMTITLQWDENPADLDAHLTGAKSNLDERFHIQVLTSEDMCWADTALSDQANCEKVDESYPNATAFLDRDDVNGYGPETIVVTQMTEGNYNFYVHHYLDPVFGTAEGSISETSNAIVKVIDNFGRTFTFNAPITGGGGEDDIWHVFTTDENGMPVSVNTIEAHDNDATGSLK